MNAKIRQAQLNKVPFMLVVGDKEIDSDSVSVRLRDGQDLGPKPVSRSDGSHPGGHQLKGVRWREIKSFESASIRLVS